jgi:Uncharacterized protein involved in biosynthesis of c-type cytochromes
LCKNMRRLKSRFLLAALLAATLALGSTPLQNPEVRRIGKKLGCQCGCQSSLTECNMLQCHFADPARAELLRMVDSGQSEAGILKAFVDRYGKAILREPPTEGFFLIGWVMPFVATAAGAVFLWWFVRRKLRPEAAAAPAAELSSEAYARYRDRIEKDLAKLD